MTTEEMVDWQNGRYADKAPDTDYVVLVRVEGKGSTPARAAVALGLGEGFIKTYLELLLPADSPLEIRSVHEAS